MTGIVRVSLDKRDSVTFARIKAQIGIKADAEVFRFLMTYYGRQEGIIPPALGMDLENTELKEAKAE